MPIVLSDVGHEYWSGDARPVVALSRIDLEIRQGELVCLVGKTGAGKTTLLEIMSGLTLPTAGRVGAPDVGSVVGMVFQEPEKQLFEATVFEDVAFGPRNQGLGVGEVEDRVAWALGMLGMDPAAVGDRSPFELSGGEQRKVALAGVLAIKPDILVLDEPSRGLDYRGKVDVRRFIDRLSAEGVTIVVVSHDMDEVASLARRLLVLADGVIVADAGPEEFLAGGSWWTGVGLDPPFVVDMRERLIRAGLGDIGPIGDIDMIAEAVARTVEPGDSRARTGGDAGGPGFTA